MDPVTLSGSVIIAAMAIKMAEKTGESLSEVTLAQMGRLFALLRDRFPGTAQTLSALPAADNPFNYEAAQQQIEDAIAADAEVKQTAEAVDQAVKADPAAQQIINNNAKMAETINGLIQGGTFNSPTFNF